MGLIGKESPCVRYLAIFFNFILLLVGGGVLGVAIWVLVAEYGAQEMSVLLGDDLYLVCSYVLIACGAVILALALLGCCGILTRTKIILGIYGVLMIITLLVLIAAAVLAFVYRGQIDDQLKKETETTLIYKYGRNIREKDNKSVTDAWDSVQQKLKCCGVTGGENSERSWAIYKLKSKWYEETPKTTRQFVPDSCCVKGGDFLSCIGSKSFPGPPALGPPLNSSMTSNPNLYTKGCYDSLKQDLDLYAKLIGGFALGTFFLMLLGVIFSCCVYRSISRKGMVV